MTTLFLARWAFLLALLLLGAAFVFFGLSDRKR